MAVKEGIDLANSYAYSDSITDLPMLELVGNPVAVNPDRELTRVARERELGHAVVPASGAAARSRAGSAEGPDAGGRQLRPPRSVRVLRLYVWLRRRAARSERRRRRRHTHSQAARTFLAIAAPSATTTRSNKSFFTGDSSPGLAGVRSVAACRARSSAVPDASDSAVVRRTPCACWTRDRGLVARSASRRRRPHVRRARCRAPRRSRCHARPQQARDARRRAPKTATRSSIARAVDRRHARPTTDRWTTCAVDDLHDAVDATRPRHMTRYPASTRESDELGGCTSRAREDTAPR